MRRKSHDAAVHLRAADSLLEQLKGGSLPVVARRAGVTAPAAEKLRWLARAYPQAARDEIGPGTLTALSPSHLEAAARAGQARTALLRRAAEEGMPVRQLRVLVDHVKQAAPVPPVTVTGSATDLASARTSLACYARLSDSGLERLLAGPNGQLIRQLAAAGQQLAARLEIPAPSNPEGAPCPTGHDQKEEDNATRAPRDRTAAGAVEDHRVRAEGPGGDRRFRHR